MDRTERGKMVIAMDTIMQHLNDENQLISWLMGGVADGDISDDSNPNDPYLDYYCEDENFSDLMGLFCRIIHRAYNPNENGELYCDRIISKDH